jgi:hypothetical protein
LNLESFYLGNGYKAPYQHFSTSVENREPKGYAVKKIRHLAIGELFWAGLGPEDEYHAPILDHIYTSETLKLSLISVIITQIYLVSVQG